MLTKALKLALTSHAKLSLVCTLNPTHGAQCQSTLQFADKAAQIIMGEVRKEPSERPSLWLGF